MTDWRRPFDYGRPAPLPARDQVAQARAQMGGAPLDLELARWRIHARDLAELRKAIGHSNSLLGLQFVIENSPALEGKGPQLFIEEPS